MLPDCNRLYNVDYEGNDIHIEHLEPPKGKSPEWNFIVCADLCFRTPGGLFWTWDQKNNKCAVKNSKSGKKKRIDFFSGNKACGNKANRLNRGGDAMGGPTKFQEFVNGSSMFTEALLSRNCNFHFVIYDKLFILNSFFGRETPQHYL